MSSVRKIEQLLAGKRVRGLCRALRSRDLLARRRAARALGELGDPAGISCLVRAVRHDTDEYVRRLALEALQKIGGEAATGALIEALFSTRPAVAQLAAQALAGVESPQARAALLLRDALLRNDREVLETVGDEARLPLTLILRSEQFATWPTARRRQVLMAAVRVGAELTDGQARELARMGVYISGVHTVGDLLNGLHSASPDVRIAAAERLAAGGQPWAGILLYRRFRREAGPGGDHRVAVALARALDRRGDSRAVDYYRNRLYSADTRVVAEAIRALGEIGTPRAIELLFWFAAEPPVPPAYRNVQPVLAALAEAGPSAVDVLRPLAEHESAGVRRLMVDVIAGSRHPETISLLIALCCDRNEAVSQAALNALAAVNSVEAAEAICGLAGNLPLGWISRALAAITDPAGPASLRRLFPDATTLTGTLYEDRQPVANATIQVLQERFETAQGGWQWQAISARARTDSSGMFALGLVDIDENAGLRLKVMLPARQPGQSVETFTADIAPACGKANLVQARVDRFLNRLLVTVSQLSDEESART